MALNNKHQHLFTHYFNNESDHIPLLMNFMKNEKQLNNGVLFSNLFNFKFNFTKNEVIIEDQCRLFLSFSPKGFQKITIDKLWQLCIKEMHKK